MQIIILSNYFIDNNRKNIKIANLGLTMSLGFIFTIMMSHTFA